MPLRTFRRTLLLLQLAFLVGRGLSAYSVLTHEAIIDTVWDTTLKPLILKRFPRLTGDQIRDAHAYAYGGSILQDMGYYPFGSKFFSDLVHYVRSGDFVMNMIRDSQDADEYAFALGTLTHYASDNHGHPEGVNLAVPLLYPKIRRRFGEHATYEDDPGAHLKTEFGFDVIEVARGNYAPQAYHDFIGFSVSKPLLERAFADTYSIQLKDVYGDLDLALGTYRHTVSGLIPTMTKAAWAAKKDEIQKAQRGITRRRFIYNMRRASYEKEWNNKYEKPGLGARILGFFLRILPKIGPLKALGFKVPNPQAETILLKSFNDTVAAERQIAAGVDGSSVPKLENLNFDTGRPTRQGEYRMADETYSKLLVTLLNKHVQPSESLRQDILTFYRDPSKITDPKALTEFNALKQPVAVTQ